jgi:hypothetical protein
MRKRRDWLVVAVSFVAGFAGGAVLLAIILLNPALAPRLIQPASAPNPTVTARRFVLVDAQGRVRATLADTAQRTALTLTSPATGRLALLAVEDPRTASAVKPGQSGPAVTASGTSQLTLTGPSSNANTTPTILLSADSTGAADLLLSGNDAAVGLQGGIGGRLVARAFDLGTELDLHAPAPAKPGEPGYEGARLNISGLDRQALTLSQGSINMSDSGGNITAIMGNAALKTAGAGGKDQTAASSLTFFDNKGRAVWHAP